MLSISELPKDDIDMIITHIIDPFNALQQALSRCKVCEKYESHSYNRLVDVNSVVNWNMYFMKNYIVYLTTTRIDSTFLRE